MRMTLLTQDIACLNAYAKLYLDTAKKTIIKKIKRIVKNQILRYSDVIREKTSVNVIEYADKLTANVHNRDFANFPHFEAFMICCIYVDICIWSEERENISEDFYFGAPQLTSKKVNLLCYGKNKYKILGESVAMNIKHRDIWDKHTIEYFCNTININGENLDTLLEAVI